MKLFVTVAVAVGCIACGPDLPNAPTGGTSNDEKATQVTCNSIDGATFVSVEDHAIGTQCGFDANQNYYCTDYSGSWSVSFQGGYFYFSNGQYGTNDGDEGPYRCSGNSIQGNGGAGAVYTGTLNASSLSWGTSGEIDTYERS